MCCFLTDCCRVVCVTTDDGCTFLQSFLSDCVAKDSSVELEVAGALVILCVALLTDLLPHCLCQLPSNDDGFTCLQSFLSDCVTKDPSVKPEFAAARTRDSACCFLTDCCRVVCVSLHTHDGFTCFQSCLGDCVTKYSSVKLDVACALMILCVAALFVSAATQR